MLMAGIIIEIHKATSTGVAAATATTWTAAISNVLTTGIHSTMTGEDITVTEDNTDIKKAGNLAAGFLLSLSAIT